MTANQDIFASTDELIDEFNKVYGDEHRDESQDWHGQGYGESVGELKGRLAVFKAWHKDTSSEYPFVTSKTYYGVHPKFYLYKKLTEQIRRIEECLK